MPNPHCECPVAGFCKRHRITKVGRMYSFCQGTADTSDCGEKYWIAWELGRMGAAAPDVPLLDGWECEPVPPSVSGMPRVSHREATSAQRGLGDKVSEALSLVGITDESVSEWLGRPCKCPGRREKLNKLGAWVMRVLKLGHSTEEYVNEIKEMVK